MKRKEIILALILVAAMWAVYWPVKDHEFVNFDDDLYITENWVVQKGLTRESVVWAFTTTFPAYWHPLTWLSIMADVELFGLDPGRHHLSNVFLHTINALLLFALLLHMSGAMWRSFFVALVFALHPLHVESVAWATSRKDVLSTFFLFLTIWAYHGYTKKQTVIRYLLVLMPYGLSLMSKPMLVTLPFILLLMDFWPLRRLHLPEPASRKKKKGKRPTAVEKPGSSAVSLVLEKLPFLGLALICTLAVSFLRTAGEPFLGFEMRPLTLRMANALVSYVSYLGQTIWPMNLGAFYPFPRSLPSWQVAGSALLLAVISLGAIRSASRRPYFLVGWLWYLVTLLPVIGLVQWGLWPAMADRFTYVPLIGISIIAAWGIPEIIGRWKHKEVVLAASGGAAALYFSVFTWFQLSQWQNGITLFTRTLEVTDNNYVAHNNLGAALKDRGEVESAIPHFREALRISPLNSFAHANLGDALRSQGKLNEAIVHYQEALKARPNNEIALHNFGLALAMKGDVDEAIIHFQKSIKVYPYNPETHFKLGLALARQNRMDEAIACFSEAIRLKPAYYPEAMLNLGVAFDSQDKLEDAISYYQKGLEVKGEDAPLHYSLGMALARKGEIDKAAGHFSEAIRHKPEFAEAHYNLGIANARLGKTREAASNFSEALRINPGFVEARKRLETLQGNTW
ncbi:MAG: tetratricopeptide repeat protein [Deltaproteobacteria bacterium]|nr:tetratricopeptide repeat protein [Deltaproteobacteria bacterium]